ncbi:MAG: hypothetical protein AMJ90_07370 [candidate division Zixibacteria bacterium SM23_73_2]|nr:MAG: hypothetical protein AMJ90_07370 [candidate division Zixibacteria bacterium SM23_73_2]
MSGKKFRYKLEYLLVLSLRFFLNLLPYRTSVFLGSLIGDITYILIPKRKKITLRNLSRCFKNKDKKSLKKIARSAYRNIGKSLAEYILFPKLNKERISELVEIRGQEHLDYALKNKKGAVMVSGHFGSWELMGAALRQRDYPVDFLVGEQHNLMVDNLMNRHREMMGIGIIKMGAATRGVIKALRQNRLIAMLSDQDAGRDGTVISFFGYPASTPKGPAAFSLKTGSPMIMGFMIRENNGKQKVIIRKIETGEKTDDREKDINRLTQAYTSLLEEYVKKYPDHWYWLHRRWKSTTGE